MNLTELQERIKHWENLHTEFKEYPVHPNDIAAALVAFANTDGGQLVIGVDKNRTLLGVEDADRILRDVDNITANHRSP